jgi:hypothetical protein
MIDPGIVVPLAIAAIIAIVVVAFVHRASTALVARRRQEHARDEALALWERADAALRIVEDRAGALRDETAAASPDALSSFDGAVAELRRVAVDITRAGAAPGLRGLGPEVDRAVAAAEEVRRGCVDPPAVHEGRRAVKHGYIEIVHAREAVVGQLTGLSDPQGPFGRQATGPGR